MTNRQDYIHKWHRFQQRYEAIYTTKFKAALREQLQQYINTGNVMAVTSQPIYNVLKELYETVGPLWAAKTGIHRLKTIEKKAMMPMGFNERIIDLMKQYYGIDLLNDAEGMTAYTREVISNVLSDAAQSGISFSEIVKILSSNPELSAMRARRIARTETVTAANGAAIINAQESGLKLKKEWIAITDRRTRHSHMNIDGTIIPIEDAFNVNGTQMMQPGVRDQPNGLPTPGSEVINCRCTTGFIQIRDRQGRLVRS